MFTPRFSRIQLQVLRPLAEVVKGDAEHYLSRRQLQAMHADVENTDPDPGDRYDPPGFDAVSELQVFLQNYRRCPTGGGNKGTDKTFPDM